MLHRPATTLLTAITNGVSNILAAITGIKNDIGITKSILTEEEIVVDQGTENVLVILPPVSGTTFSGHTSLDVVVQDDMSYRGECLASDASVDLAVGGPGDRSVNVDFACESLIVTGINPSGGTANIDGKINGYFTIPQDFKNGTYYTEIQAQSPPDGYTRERSPSTYEYPSSGPSDEQMLECKDLGITIEECSNAVIAQRREENEQRMELEADQNLFNNSTYMIGIGVGIGIVAFLVLRKRKR